MIKAQNKIMVVVCGLLMLALPMNAKAIVTGHATGHATAHPAGAHPSAHVTAGATARPNTTTHATGIVTEHPNVNHQTGRQTTTRTINRSAYKSLNTSQRVSYNRWNNYYGKKYPNQTANEVYARHFYWAPYWYFTSSHNEHDKNIPVDKNGKQRYWIKIGDKVIFVPKNIWKKVNKGDKVKLIDDNHVEINKKIYAR